LELSQTGPDNLLPDLHFDANKNSLPTLHKQIQAPFNLKMDAHALLTSQGWRGKGHSLHPTSDTTGLSRPILVSQKTNNHGIGKKQHKTSDMWWMDAFDKSLQGLDTSEKGKVVQTITSGGLDMVVKGGAKWVGSGGGLYTSFVRGESLRGTLTPDSERSGVEEPSPKKRKRHGQLESPGRGEKRKAAKRVAEIESVSEDIPGSEAEEARKVETKEERKERQATEKALKVQESAPDGKANEILVEQSTANIETKEERKARKARKAAEKSSRKQKAASEQQADMKIIDSTTENIETKEERRERKRQKHLL